MYHSSVGKLLITSGLVCVFAEPLITWEKQDVLSFLLTCTLSLSLSLLLLCVCERINFHSHALPGGTCEVLCTLYQCHEASMLRILSRAALAQCASHRLRHTHTRSSTVDSLLLCQGISHDQSQSFVSPGVKKVKTARRRMLEGNMLGLRAYTLFMAQQKCASPELLQKHLQ